MNNDTTEFRYKYIEVKQPIGAFYIVAMDWRDLISIVAHDIRRIQGDSIDNIIGIQREVSPSRIKQIASYVQNVDATFPTSIIIAIDSVSKKKSDQNDFVTYKDYETDNVFTDNVSIDETNQELVIKRRPNIAYILDGQHRLVGLKDAFKQFDLLQDTNCENFYLNVSVFIDIDKDNQAQIFSIINKAQTKVNKSLVYDLFEYSKVPCPQKTAHEIIRLLNNKEKSPLYDKIKLLGVSRHRIQTISQATIAELIISYISEDPMKDRDSIKRSFSGKSRSAICRETNKEKLIFRSFFIEDRDIEMFKVLFFYFSAVQIRWPKAWNGEIENSILPKSTGIIALMRYLYDIYYTNGSTFPSSTNEYLKFLEVEGLDDSHFTKEIFVPGSSGQVKLYNSLKTRKYQS